MFSKIKFHIVVLSISVNFYAQTFVQRYADIANQVSQVNITNNLTTFEALGVKSRNTVALENTYQWLVNQYKSYGYTDAQITTDTFSYLGATCKNLIVTKQGTVYPNTYVIVCGHYDSIIGTGTNDNGSGVASILEMARLLKNVNTEYSIKFINFSGEEDGLKGSQHYVNSVVNGTNPKMDIRIVFNLDQIGGVAGMTNNTITCERDTDNSPSTNNVASATFTNELITCVGLYSPLQTILSYAYSSDYMSFEANNEVITGFFETNQTTHGHTATDLLVNMDPVYNYNVAKAAVGGLLHFAKAETSLANPDFDTRMKVNFFPNPVENFLQINMENLNTSRYVISLIDLNGKLVLVKTYDRPKVTEILDVSSLNKGMYLVKLQFDEGEIVKKIIME